jgi:hypothetical protein
MVRTWIALHLKHQDVLYCMWEVYTYDSTGKQRPNYWKIIISLKPYIAVYTMPVWYILVYTSINQYANTRTCIYRYTPQCTKSSSLVLSRWWRFQMRGPGWAGRLGQPQAGRPRPGRGGGGSHCDIWNPHHLDENQYIGTSTRYILPVSWCGTRTSSASGTITSLSMNLNVSYWYVLPWLVVPLIVLNFL